MAWRGKYIYYITLKAKWLDSLLYYVFFILLLGLNLDAVIFFLEHTPGCLYYGLSIG